MLTSLLDRIPPRSRAFIGGALVWIGITLVQGATADVAAEADAIEAQLAAPGRAVQDQADLEALLAADGAP
jgi:hypothetical protein